MNFSDIVESILRMKVIKGKQLCLVRWQGYTPAEDTWEPSYNLPIGLVTSFEKKQKRTTQVKKKKKQNKNRICHTLGTRRL